VLTATAIKNAKATDREQRLWDGQHGLYLVITTAGSKRWCVKYKHEGKTRIAGFGNWPEVSLQDARDKAVDLRRALKDGKDPVGERKAQKRRETQKRKAQNTAREATARKREGLDANSFEAVAWRWFDDVWRHGKADRYVRQQEQRLESNIIPYLGARPIAQIEARELVHMALAIEKHSPELARRALEVCDAIFRYAVVHELAPRNTAKDIKASDFLKAKKVKNQPRVDAKDAGALLRAIDGYPVETTRAALKMIHYTFVRATELAGARFDEFEGLNTDAPTWKIPGSRMKAERDHWVPCSPQVAAIVREQRKAHPHSKHMFPGQGKTPHIHPGTMLLALERLGYRGKHSVHGARGLASTVLHEHQQFPHEAIELQLAHAPEDKVSAAYNHARLIDVRRKMMCWYSDFLDAQQHEAKVIPIAS
jgi:integrase